MAPRQQRTARPTLRDETDTAAVEDCALTEEARRTPPPPVRPAAEGAKRRHDPTDERGEQGNGESDNAQLSAQDNALLAGEERDDSEGGRGQGSHPSGYIKSIELVDFMSHKHFSLTFKPTINFIGGHNGSGKSAILAGIVVCLGSRSKATQRAPRLDEHIRRGANSARIRIKLYNGGENPYMPEIFGEYIIIERRLMRDRPSSYAIHSALRQKAVSSKQAMVCAICDHFGIQVDNPLTILTQETARSFLASANPKQLYDFFIKGTEIERLSYDYTFTKDKVNEAKARLSQFTQSVPHLQESVSQIEKQFAEMEKMEGIQQAIQQIRKEMTWAMIQAKEDDYSKLQAKLCDHEAVLADAKDRLAGTCENLKKTEAQVRDLEDELTRTMTATEPYQSQRAETVAMIRGHERSIGELDLELQMMNKELTSLQGHRDDVERRLRVEVEKEKSGSATDTIKEALRVLDDELVSLNRLIYDNRQAEKEAEEKQVENEESLAGASKALDGLQRKYYDEQHALQIAESTKGNSIRAFGENMPAALEDVRRAAASFSRPPIGPAGMHIRLKEREWAVALESIIGVNVDAFIVHNQGDERALRTILSKHGLRNSIVIVNFDSQLDISSGVPDARFMTSLQVLEIDNETVRKMLIMMCGIEKNILIKDRNTAMRIAKEAHRNVNMVFTMSARISAGAKGVSVIQLISNPRRPKILEDSEARIQELKERVSQMKNHLAIAQGQKGLLERTSSDLTAIIQSSRRQVETADAQLRRNRSEERRLKDELRDDAPIACSLFEAELAETDEKMSALDSQASAAQEDRNGLLSEKKRLTSDMDKIEKAIRSLQSSQNSIMEQITACSQSRRTVERELAKVKSHIEQQERILSSSAEQASGALELLERMRHDAERICSRVPVRRTLEELDRELTAREECLHSDRNAHVDPIKLKASLDEKRRLLAESQLAINSSMHLISTFGQTIEQRMRACHDFKISVAKMSCTSFVFLMNARGFQGSLHYQHNKNELHIRAIPQGQAGNAIGSGAPAHHTASAAEKSDRKRARGELEAAAEDQENRDIKQLSGGEKSYSTSCFLFSLWQALGSPIRCLDEFDVFMDSVNRTYALELLVNEARASKVQFILITPISIPKKYHYAPDIGVQILKDPERNQSVLN